MKFLFAVLIAVLAFASFSEACASKCKHLTNTDFPGCTLAIKGCACVSLKLKTTYQVTVCDSANGFCASSGHYKNQDDAGREATYNFFSQSRGCNCKGSSIPFGTCTLVGQACGYFPTLGDVLNKNIMIKFYVKDSATGVEGSAGPIAPADAANGALAAIRDLNNKTPLAKCGIPIPSADSVELPAILQALIAELPSTQPMEIPSPYDSA